MKALTIWQPWASLIMIGAKPYEFRSWPAPASVRGQRIVIHAGKRPAREDEIREIKYRLDRFNGAGLQLDPHKAMELLVRVPAAAFIKSVGLGTAELGEPERCCELFRDTMDQDDINPDMWAWPLTDVRWFDAPIPSRGERGFWNWSHAS